jgi:hypothetical protein
MIVACYFPFRLWLQYRVNRGSGPVLLRVLA